MVWCFHLVKITEFLNEVSSKGMVTPNTQQTYSYYYHKKKFWNTINTLADSSLITVTNNFGDPIIKLTFKGDFFRIMLSNIVLKKDLGEIKI